MHIREIFESRSQRTDPPSVVSLGEDCDEAETLITCEDCGKLKNSSTRAASSQSLKCPICGDVNTGYHYGVESCESCKGFFRRAVQRKEVFTCKFDGSCTVSLYTRRNCAACRYNKCIRKGMLTSAVRENRRRGGCKRYASSPKKQLSTLQNSGSTYGELCKCAPPSVSAVVTDQSASTSSESSISSPSLASFTCNSDTDDCTSNISPLLIIKQCFMAYDECIKQPNLLLEQRFFDRRALSIGPILTTCPGRTESIIRCNPNSNHAFFAGMPPNDFFGLQSPCNDILRVSQFVLARKETHYVERNIKWATSFFDQDVRCVLLRLSNNWISLGFFDYLIQLGSTGSSSNTSYSPSSSDPSSPLSGGLLPSNFSLTCAYRSHLFQDRHLLKVGCDPITERENDVMMAKMQNDMDYYAESSGIDLEGLEKMLASGYTEEVGGVSLMGIAQQMNELKLTTGEVSIARVILLLSTGLNTTLTEDLVRFQVGILRAFESFCKSDDRMSIDPYERFNIICLVLFDIERYVSSNLATEMKPNNILRPFLEECPSETQVMELFYSATVTEHKLGLSPRPHLSEYAPPRKVTRTSPLTSHFPLALKLK